MPVKYFTEDEWEEQLKKKNMFVSVITGLLHIHRKADEERLRKARDGDYYKLETGDVIKPELGRYAFIPNDLYRVATLLLEAFKLLSVRNSIDNILRLKKSYKFLDAGCGVGHIVRMAQSLGFKAEGIELDPENAKIGKEVAYGVRQGDILKANYKTYDVIYYYVPIRAHKLEKQFERRVENQAKKGAILICCEKRDERIFKDSRFEKISTKEGTIFRKVRMRKLKNE